MFGGGAVSRRRFLKAGFAFAAVAALPRVDVLLAEPARALWNERMIGRIAGMKLGDPLTFGFCADAHVPFDDRGVVAQIAKKANQLKLSFMLIGGDTVQVGHPANFSRLFQMMKRFDMPVVCAMGNHDTSFEDYADQEEWTKRFGTSFYSFDAGPARFIALNNADFKLTDEQYEFLDAALRTDLNKFVFMHRPPNYLNPIYSTPMPDDGGRFRAAVENGGATAVLTGHEHHFGEYEAGGVRYIVSGGAGGRLNNDTENNFHHFMRITTGLGKFEYEAVEV